MAPKYERPVMVVAPAPNLAAVHKSPFSGSTGAVLLKLLNLKSYSELCTLFDLVNLYDEPPAKWNPELACVRATALGMNSLAEVFVLCGARVQDAFGVLRVDHPVHVKPIAALTRRPLAFCIPHTNPSKVSGWKDEKIVAAVKHLLVYAKRLATGDELRDIMCREHGAERMPLFEDHGADNGRLYACGCEIHS